VVTHNAVIFQIKGQCQRHLSSWTKKYAVTVSKHSTQFSICQKNSGGRRLASIEGARIEAPQVPRGWGVGTNAF